MPPTGRDHEAAWRAALDELEARLQDALAADAVLTPGGWTPDVDLGPLPAALAERATVVLTRLRTAEAELTRRLDAVAGDLSEHRSRTRRTPVAVTPAASLLNRLA